MQQTDVLGVKFDHVTMEEAVKMTEAFVTAKKPHLIVTANPETVMRAKNDQLFAEVLDKASLVVADGIGVVWASKNLGKPVPSKIPGIELAEGILSKSSDKGWKVFLLGSESGVADEAAKKLKKAIPNLKLVGSHHGFFKPGLEEETVIRMITEAKPDVLLVALGVPRQEKWLAAHLGTMKVPVSIGVGGSFNVWAGIDKRAPLWIRKIHLEWLYRLIRQPWRIKRIAVLPIFVLSVFFTRFRSGR